MAYIWRPLAYLFLAVCFFTVAHAQEDAAYRVYVSNEYGGNISVIDPETSQVVDTIQITERAGEVRPRGMAVSPDGGTIYVAVSDFNPRVESDEDKIVAIDVRTNEISGEYDVGTDPERLDLNPEGTQLWAANEDVAQATGFNLETGEQLGSFSTGIEPEGVGVSPDGAFAYITGETSHTITVIDAKALSVVTHVLVSQRPRDVIFNEAGDTAYISGEIGGGISVMDTASQQITRTTQLGLDARVRRGRWYQHRLRHRHRLRLGHGHHQRAYGSPPLGDRHQPRR